MSDRAGQPALASDLIDVPELIAAYFERVPDVTIRQQRVAFGTSGHRGSSLDTAFNETHIAAITQAIVDYRSGQGITGPLFIGKDTHALSRPAETTALEVLVANGVRVLVDEFDDWVPTPATQPRDHRAQRRRPRRCRRRHRHNALPQPTARRRLQVQPAARRARRQRRHDVDRRPGQCQLIAGGNRRRETRRADCRGDLRFPRRLRRGPREDHRHRGDRTLRPAHRSGPARRRERALLGAHRRALRPRPDRGQSRGGPRVGLHDLGLGREDPHGPLVAVRDGLGRGQAARLRHPHRQRRRRRPARHRHARRRAHEPEPLSRGGDPLPLSRTGRDGARMPRSARPSSRAR